VATIGRPSGTAATASAIAVSTMVSRSLPPSQPTTATTTATTRVSATRRRPSRSSRFSSGVTSSSASSAIRAIWPSSVFMPVATTRPAPLPPVTAVPLVAIEGRSAIGASASTGSVVLVTGTDSPVSALSSQVRPLASTMRRSAVTTSPASRSTTSPGTSDSASVIRPSPSRRTRDSNVPSRRSASIERTAFHSVTKPIAALTRIAARMAKPWTISVIAKDSTTATARMAITRFLNWSARIFQGLARTASLSRFGPCSRIRRRASSSERPVSRSTSRASTVSSTLRAALGAWTRLYAERYAAQGLRANAILPGFVDSYPLDEARRAAIPVGRYAQVAEIARAAAFLASDDSSYVTGQSLLVDGGIVRASA